MAEQIVTLNPSESKVVSFEATPHEARTYQVSVDGLTGSFVAIPAPPAVEIVGFRWVPDTYAVSMLPSQAQSWRTVGFGFDFRNNGAEPIEAYAKLILKHTIRPADEREQSFWAWRGVLVDGMQTWQPLTVNPYTGYADKGMPIFYWNPYPTAERQSPTYDRCFLVGEVTANGLVTTATSKEFDVVFQ